MNSFHAMRDGIVGESKIVCPLSFVERSKFENFSSPTNWLKPPLLETGRLLHPVQMAIAEKSKTIDAVFFRMFFMAVPMPNGRSGQTAVLDFQDRRDKPCCAKSPMRGGHFRVCKCAARFPPSRPSTDH